MAGLWTPTGEHEPAPEPRDEPSGAGPSAAELAQLRDQLLATPVTTIIANHVIGMWELAALHLWLTGGPDDMPPAPPDLYQAGIALDAVAAVVEGLGDRLGENEPVLRDALTQLRLAYVQVAEVLARSAGDAARDSGDS